MPWPRTARHGHQTRDTGARGRRGLGRRGRPGHFGTRKGLRKIGHQKGIEKGGFASYANHAGLLPAASRRRKTAPFGMPVASEIRAPLFTCILHRNSASSLASFTYTLFQENSRARRFGRARRPLLPGLARGSSSSSAAGPGCRWRRRGGGRRRRAAGRGRLQRAVSGAVAAAGRRDLGAAGGGGERRGSADNQPWKCDGGNPSKVGGGEAGGWSGGLT